MRGPPNTCYEAGINQYNTSLLSLSSPSHSLLTGAFVLSIEFLDNYPSIPPVVRFLTPVSECLHTLLILVIRFIIVTSVPVVVGYVIVFLGKYTYQLLA